MYTCLCVCLFACITFKQLKGQLIFGAPWGLLYKLFFPEAIFFSDKLFVLSISQYLASLLASRISVPILEAPGHLFLGSHGPLLPSVKPYLYLIKCPAPCFILENGNSIIINSLYEGTSKSMWGKEWKQNIG